MNKPRPTLSLTGAIHSEAELRNQYKDSSNLAARAQIYRFATGPGFGPAWVFDQMLAEIAAKAEVLELGCGPGTLWKQNLSRVPRDLRVTLTDLMPGMAAEASRELEGDPRFRVQVMDAQKIESADASFDGVIASHMLYHVPDLPKALKEIRRVLRPGGKLLATTNSEQHMRPMKELIFEFLGDRSPIPAEIPFSLENGERLIEPIFDRVQRRSIKSELRVTEPEAVVRYILSIEGAPERIVGERLRQLRQRVCNEIHSAGAFVLSTEAGMFIAS